MKKHFIHFICLFLALAVSLTLVSLSKVGFDLPLIIIASWQLGRWGRGIGTYMVERFT